MRILIRENTDIIPQARTLILNENNIMSTALFMAKA